MTKRAILFNSVQWIAAILICLFFVYGVLQYQESWAAYEERVREWKSSVAVSTKIKELRSKPGRATQHSHSQRAMAEAIEQAAGKARITPQQIARIEPQAPRRSGDSPYMEHATVVKVEGIELLELALLATHLRGLDASLGQLHITSLRVDAPYQMTKQNEDSEVWNVELILTYFVYSPKSSA